MIISMKGRRRTNFLLIKMFDMVVIDVAVYFEAFLEIRINTKGRI